MPRHNISSASPYEASIGFSRAVRVGNAIHVAGTAPIAPDGTTAGPGDAYAQTKRCLEIIRQAIESAGGKLTDVVRTRIMVTDMAYWEDVGRAHGEVFREVRPASSLFEVTRLVHDEWLVEIEADAVVEGDE